jgi:hypothetical protein
VEHGCCLVDITLADVRDGWVPEDDRLDGVAPVGAACGVLQDRPALALSPRVRSQEPCIPSEVVGGEG